MKKLLQIMASVTLMVGAFTLIATQSSNAVVQAAHQGSKVVLSLKQAERQGIAASPVLTNLSDGGTRTTINLSGGEVLQYSVPPTGFNPTSASASQLQEYGFPARPSGGEALNLWLKAMSVPLLDESAHMSLVLTPLSQVANGAPGTQVGGTQNTYSNINWGGFDAKGSSTTYGGAQGYFNVPAVTNTSACSVPYFSIWSGIGGGIGSSSLIQSGLIYNLNGVTDPTSADWSSFIEFLYGSVNHGPTDLIALAGKSWHVNTADTMLTQTTYTTSNRGTGNFYLEDASTGQYASYSVTDISAYYDGSTAETIQESHSGYPFDAGTVSWLYVSQQLASSGSWQPLLSASATDKFYGYYSSPSTLSSSDNTSYTMTSNPDC